MVGELHIFIYVTYHIDVKFTLNVHILSWIDYRASETKQDLAGS